MLTDWYIMTQYSAVYIVELHKIVCNDLASRRFEVYTYDMLYLWVCIIVHVYIRIIVCIHIYIALCVPRNTESIQNKD